MDDDELSRVMTHGLRRRADDVDVTGVGAAPDHARSTARRRRHTRLGVVAAVAALIVVPVAYVAAHDPVESGDRRGPATSVDAIPNDWRVESYRGVELRVPPDWGWGGVPSEEHGELLFCGTGAFAVPSGKPDPDGAQDVPYVGRAGFGMTDLCQMGRDLASSPPFVWLGSPLEPGSSTVAGLPVETVDVGGTRVSVGDDDVRERDRILATIDRIQGQDANGCEPRLQQTAVGLTGDAMTVSDVSLCVHHVDTEAGDGFLSFSTVVGGAQAQQIFDAIRDTPTAQVACPATGKDPPAPYDVVKMTFRTDEGPVPVTARIEPGCGGYDGHRFLSPENVRPWATGGVALYISAGQLDPSIGRFFHPIPG